MIIEKFGTGSTVELAKEDALKQMGITVDSDIEYDFEIVSLPQKKLLGLFGGSPAKVRVFREVADEVKKSAASKTEEVKEVKAKDNERKAKATGKLTDKEIENTVDYLKKVLTLMGVEDFTAEPQEIEDGITININGAKLGVVIGRKGETIDALQHLVSLTANKGKDDYCRVTLNPGEYREKRETVLVNIAKKSAEKAIKFRRNVALEPMNSYERRIIHNTLQDVEGVESWSVGENESRRVIIGNKEFANASTGRNRQHNRNRSRNGRSNYRTKPNHSVNSERTRAPMKDSASVPLYGVIKTEDK